MIGDCPLKGRGDEIKRLIPAGSLAMNFGVKRTTVESKRFGERRTLGAKTTVVGGMVRISPHTDLALVIDGGDNAAADAAIGAGRLVSQGMSEAPRVDIPTYSAAAIMLSSMMER